MTIKHRARQFWSEWLRPLVLPFILITAAKSALADINFVPSGSMQPTILEGDEVVVNKLAYDLKVPFTTFHLAHWADPARGDIVVCFEPGSGLRLVKRVIGLPGDTIELRRDTLFVNGRPLSYRPLAEAVSRELPPGERGQAVFAEELLGIRNHAVMALPARPAPRDFGPLRVPAGRYFMMGDNRDNSEDSRFFGGVPRSEIVGEAKAIFFSVDLSRFGRPRFDRFFTRLN